MNNSASYSGLFYMLSNFHNSETGLTAWIIEGRKLQFPAVLFIAKTSLQYDIWYEWICSYLMECSNIKIGSRYEDHGFIMTLFNHSGFWIAYSTDTATDEISAKM